jgi:large subunit ribosomal protein L13
MKTIYVNPTKVERKWYLLDAEGQRLGRIAEKAATLLRGKHKPEFVPHQEIGDYVVIINADKVVVTGRKAKQKMYYHHSTYPGGLSAEPFEEMIVKKPTYPLEKAIKGMLPKNSLGRKLFNNVKIYAGSDHPHSAQKPEKIDL